MDKEVLSENGCGKLHFLGLKLGSGFEEPGGTPHQEFPGVLLLPLPPPRTQTAQLMRQFNLLNHFRLF